MATRHVVLLVAPQEEVGGGQVGPAALVLGAALRVSEAREQRDEGGCWGYQQEQRLCLPGGRREEEVQGEVEGATGREAGLSGGQTGHHLGDLLLRV
jgi:hypothetical protein